MAPSPHENESDEDLVGRFRAGDRKSFDSLLARYARPILNFFVRALGRVGRAEELSQEAFVTAFQRLPTFDATRRFRPWLYGIATNLVRNEWRAVKKLPRSIEDLPQDGGGGGGPAAPAADPQKAAADHEVAEIIWQGVRELSDEQRAVFVLRMYHGLSYAEIAEILECPEGTAKSRMHFAAEAMRKHLRARGVS
ncbi:MAG: RNA polymerase sigma factor [Planctomycetales bacterium]|nr:RNA polymerase sigma factor [Planctomycetales bacterium]